ncbi:MAG: hypothetical protein HYU98_06205, partial [Deltaproteobacteria bacterium]|nr:hypothetical protein [Deltaproteobacteria bacterium]
RAGENIGIESAICKIISGPERKGLSKNVVIVEALLGLARGRKKLVNTTEDALEFWDETAKKCGYESLETYLMLRFGYHAAAILPSDMRVHAVEEADDVESGALKENKHRYILSRGKEIKGALIDTGMDEIEAHDLAETIAAIEFRNPEWKGKLKLGDFVDRQFEPTEERKAFLVKLSNDSLEDLFPEYDVHPGMPDALAKLAQFMGNYRTAERHYDSPSLKDVHCFKSASRVLMMLRSKGFNAHILNTSKDLSDGRTINHVVVLAEIDGIEYAIDINHQQFGPENDRLILVPRNEIGKIGLRERADQLGIDHDTINFAAKADQKAIREYMLILGLMPESEAEKPSAELSRAAEAVPDADEKDYDEEWQVTYENNGMYHFDPEQGLFNGSKKLNTTTIRKIGDDIYIIVWGGGYPTAWKVGEGGKARRVNYGFYYDLEKRPKIMIGDKKIMVKILGKNGSIYLVDAKGIGLMAWQDEPSNIMESSEEIMRYYFSKTGKVYVKDNNETAGRLIDAKVVERVGDNVLIKARGYDGPVAWAIFEGDANFPVENIYFSKSQKLAIADGRVKGVKTLFRDGDIYLLEDQTHGAVRIDPATGEMHAIEKYFFKMPGAEYRGAYFSLKTGVTGAIVVDGDLFSVKNRQAFEALEADIDKLEFVMVDSDGHVLQNKIYPDPRDKSVFWTTNDQGRVKKVTANQIGDGPFYIFTIPQEIKKYETTYDGSGSAFNVSVWKRDGSKTRETTSVEVNELAREHIGDNVPNLTRLSDVAVVGESVPIDAKGLKRIKNGFSWKVKVTGTEMDRTIEVKIEASSEKKARATLDDLQETFRIYKEKTDRGAL